MINDAKALLAANDLKSAIQAATNSVKSKPTDTLARTALFELLIFAGEFDRAEKQLDALGQQDANALIGTQVYRQCIAAERERQKVFAGAQEPTFITSRSSDVDLLLDAVRSLQAGETAAAREKLDEAETLRPAHGGKLNNNTDFSDFRDYNDLTASVLEVFLKGKYVWLPFSQIRNLKITKPITLRDLCWTQASVEALDGTQGEVLLPALYANSFKNENDVVRLGRATDWLEMPDDIFIGVGTRLFSIDNVSKLIFEVETAEFNF